MRSYGEFSLERGKCGQFLLNVQNSSQFQIKTDYVRTYPREFWVGNSKIGSVLKYHLSEKKLITPYVWNHITVTYDSQIGTAVIYINGKESARGKGSGLISKDWNKRMGIGRHKGHRYLDGDVDEFKIYDVPLVKEQVEELSKKCDFNKYCKYRGQITRKKR